MGRPGQLYIGDGQLIQCWLYNQILSREEPEFSGSFYWIVRAKYPAACSARSFRAWPGISNSLTRDPESGSTPKVQRSKGPKVSYGDSGGGSGRMTSDTPLLATGNFIEMTGIFDWPYSPFSAQCVRPGSESFNKCFLTSADDYRGIEWMVIACHLLNFVICQPSG